MDLPKTVQEIIDYLDTLGIHDDGKGRTIDIGVLRARDRLIRYFEKYGDL